MKTLLTTFLILLSTTIAWAASPSQQLQKILNSVSSVQANFTQKDYAGKKRVLRNSRGTLAIKKPGMFRWNITYPSNVSMISNGKLLWIYDKNLKQATVKKVNKNSGSSPAMILSNRIRLLGNYFQVWKKNGWYYLVPKYTNDELKQVQLKFNGNRLSQMWILDKLGQKSYLKFSNVRINRNLSNSQFNFRASKGVDVVR